MTISFIQNIFHTTKHLTKLQTYHKNLTTLWKSPIIAIPVQLMQRSVNAWQFGKCNKQIHELKKNETSNPHERQVTELQVIVKPQHKKELLEARLTQYAMLCFLAETGRLAVYLRSVPSRPIEFTVEAANMIGTGFLYCAETQHVPTQNSSEQLWRSHLRKTQYALAITSNIMWIFLGATSTTTTYTRYATMAVSTCNLAVSVYDNREVLKQTVSTVCAAASKHSLDCIKCFE